MPSHREKPRRKSTLMVLWESFWNPPAITCPRCGSAIVDYYDPFFFSPVRTLKGKRRIKCRKCRFVWRPSSRGRSYLDKLNPFKNY
ncbi:MAG: hypothetical protein GF401_01665 [Chitinivibrionales bacterium]|nr:hypothetical protein [Chitinivibrionales bacterium]